MQKIKILSPNIVFFFIPLDNFSRAKSFFVLICYAKKLAIFEGHQTHTRT